MALAPKSLDHGALEYTRRERRQIVVAAQNDAHVVRRAEFDADIFAVILRELRRGHQDAPEVVAGAGIAGVEHHPALVHRETCGPVGLVISEARRKGHLDVFAEPSIRSTGSKFAARRKCCARKNAGVGELPLVKNRAGGSIGARDVQKRSEVAVAGGPGEDEQAAVAVLAHEARAAAQKIKGAVEQIGGQHEGNLLVSRADRGTPKRPREKKSETGPAQIAEVNPRRVVYGVHFE